MFDRLKDKVVLITGASSGIGESCAYHFAQYGSHLVLTGRRDSRLNTVKQKCMQINSSIKVHVAQLDIRDSKRVDEVITALPLDFKAIDVLVNNAGLAIGVDEVADVTNEAIDRVIDTNVKGLLYVTRAVLKGMKERGHGHIINIGSIAGNTALNNAHTAAGELGLSAYPNGSVYCASKYAVHAISQSLRAETISVPIKVTEINPGKVETEFSKVRFGGDEVRAAKVYEGIEAMTGDDVAEAVVFAASRHKRCVISDIVMLATGQVSATVVHRKL